MTANVNALDRGLNRGLGWPAIRLGRSGLGIPAGTSRTNGSRVDTDRPGSKTPEVRVRGEERQPLLTEVVARPVVRAMSEENARWYELSGQLLAVLLRGEETGGGLAAVEITEARGQHPPRHIHRRHDELIYVLDGELTFEVGGERRPAPTGTLVFIPRGTEHGFAVETELARLLVVITPAGLEGGFLEASVPAWSLDPAARPAAPASLDHLIGLAEKYDGEVTGPPIEPSR